MVRVKSTESLADELREAREAAALSQVELARRLRVSPRTVQNWEAGRAPQPRHRRAIQQFIAKVDAELAA